MLGVLNIFSKSSWLWITSEFWISGLISFTVEVYVDGGFGRFFGGSNIWGLLRVWILILALFGSVEDKFVHLFAMCPVFLHIKHVTSS